MRFTIVSIAVLLVLGACAFLFLHSGDDEPTAADLSGPAVAAQHILPNVPDDLPATASSREVAVAEIRPTAISTGLPSVPEAAWLTSAVAGRVVDEADRAIPGAKLELKTGMGDRGGPAVLPFGDYAVAGKSDSSGQFRLAVPPQGVFTLEVTRDGFETRSIGPLMPGDDVTVRLRPGVVLTGRVVDAETELPVAHANVLLEGRGVDRSTLTGADGTFAIADLAAGAADLEVIGIGYEPLNVEGLMLSNVAVPPLALKLAPGVPVSGTVKDGSNAAPVAGALVELAAERRVNGDRQKLAAQSTKTDGAGRFHFEKAARSGLSLEASAPGFASERLRIESEGEEAEKVVDVALKPGTRIGGVVHDQSGVVVAGAEVRLLGADRFDVTDRNVKTGDDGAFAFTEVRPGNYQLVASSAEKNLAPKITENVEVDEARPANEQVLTLVAGAMLIGDVVDGLGQPAPFAAVNVEGVDGNVWRALRKAPLVFTDANGAFTLKGLPEGMVTLSARRDAALSNKVEIALAPSGTHTAHLVLNEGAILTGIVTDLRGVPLDDVLVTAMIPFWNASGGRGPGGGNANSASGGRGRDGGPGRRDGGGPGGGGGRGPGGGGPPPMRFDGGRRDFRGGNFGGMFGGRMVSNFRGLTRTRPDGTFVLKGLAPAEKLMVSFRRDGYSMRFENDVVPGAKGLEVRLAPLIQLSGRVTESRTHGPLVDFAIQADIVEDPSAANNPQSAQAAQAAQAAMFRGRGRGRSSSFHSADGSYVVSDLQPGIYDVRARADGYAESPPVRVEVAEGRNGVIDFDLATAALVTGRVVAKDGSPIARVSVFLTEKPQATGLKTDGNSGRPGRPTNRDSGNDGTYRFASVKPGVYQIGVGRPNSPVFGPIDVEVREGERVTQDFTIESVGELSVEVKVAGGFSLEDAEIAVRGAQSGLRQRKRTDGFGVAKFKNLIADTYTVSTSRDGFQNENASVEVRSGGSASKQFTLTKNP